LIAAHRAAMGGAATGALEAFGPHNDALKALVTDWQMRPSPNGPVANDHSDPVYDARVLAAIHARHDLTAAWLAAISPQGALSLYAQRLNRAMAKAAGGALAYLVSPRVDSYHNVWFELHEYLIRLAGRTRQEEEVRHEAAARQASAQHA